MKARRFKQVDVFTQTPFLGNPVAVILDATDMDGAEMQRMAAWTNLSETAFVLPPTTPKADYRLRIFTPRAELPFAGHPTIGSAHAALEAGIVVPVEGCLRQECAAGVVELGVRNDAEGSRVHVQVPRATVRELDIGSELAKGLGVRVKAGTAILSVDVGPIWLVVDLDDADAVARLRPDMSALARLSEQHGLTGVTVFGKANDGPFAVHVRSFAPAMGAAEDPVCGSGNACVAAYLIHTGLLTGVGSEYSARQGMQVGRDGRVFVQVDQSAQKILIGGYSVTCVDGQIHT